MKPELKCLEDGWREKVEAVWIWSEPPYKMFYMFTVLSLIYSPVSMNITLWAFIIALSMLRYVNFQEPHSPFKDGICRFTPNNALELPSWLWVNQMWVKLLWVKTFASSKGCLRLPMVFWKGHASVVLILEGPHFSSHLLFDLHGRAVHRWGMEEFVGERNSVFSLDSLLQTQIHLLPLKQPNQGCVVQLEAQSCFWFIRGARYRVSPFSAMP